MVDSYVHRVSGKYGLQRRSVSVHSVRQLSSAISHGNMMISQAASTRHSLSDIFPLELPNTPFTNSPCGSRLSLGSQHNETPAYNAPTAALCHSRSTISPPCSQLYLYSWHWQDTQKRRHLPYFSTPHNLHPVQLSFRFATASEHQSRTQSQLVCHT